MPQGNLNKVFRDGRIETSGDFVYVYRKAFRYVFTRGGRLVTVTPRRPHERDEPIADDRSHHLDELAAQWGSR